MDLRKEIRYSIQQKILWHTNYNHGLSSTTSGVCTSHMNNDCRVIEWYFTCLFYANTVDFTRQCFMITVIVVIYITQSRKATTGPFSCWSQPGPSTYSWHKYYLLLYYFINHVTGLVLVVVQKIQNKAAGEKNSHYVT